MDAYRGIQGIFTTLLRIPAYKIVNHRVQSLLAGVPFAWVEVGHSRRLLSLHISAIAS